jgi:CelD/BcsL family acetyltransferase involved in cellulose biosynthesis
VRVAVIDVRVSGVGDFAKLGERWRELEQRAALSFFQSWTWVGCLAAERFPDPVLVEASENQRTIGMALFNRVRRRVGPAVLHLSESGVAELDCPYVEQNGVLAETGRADEVTELCLRAVAPRHDLVLSGVGEPVLTVLRRAARLVRAFRSQASPFADLAALRATGEDYLAGRSANTRLQIRRSARFYERTGAIKVELADSAAAALAMLDEMAVLHQTAWTARGRPGCFSRPFFRRFHRELIMAAMPRGEVAMLKVTCGDTVVGLLYNFVYRRRMLAYQGGFGYAAAEPRAKPGLTCHHQAISFAIERELDTYDFLAGDDRYKRSLADRSHRQIWAEAGPVWSPRLLLGTCGDLIRSSQAATGEASAGVIPPRGSAGNEPMANDPAASGVMRGA